MYLTKQQILEAQDRKFVDVEVPEWGGTVRVATFTGERRDTYETLFSDIRGGRAEGSIRAALVAASIVDENGATLFTMEDVIALGKKSGVALGRVFDVALEVNGISDKKKEELKGN